MARIFLSYARRDGEETAENLRAKLNLAGHIVWRDREDMRGGYSWREQIYNAVETVHCVIVLLTPHSVASEQVKYEWDSAIELEKLVIGIQLLECDVPEELRRLHYHVATTHEHYQNMLMQLVRDLSELDMQLAAEQAEKNVAQNVSEELTEYIQVAVHAYSQRIKDLHQLSVTRLPVEPYKELYAFDLADEQIFFGRDTDSRQLQRVVLRERVAILHARSGAGKTSLINAGLMSRLITAGYVPVYARTHTDPVEAIKRAIITAVPRKAPPELQELTLHQFLRIAETALGVEHREFVIIIDQFEEFFVLYPQLKQRIHFINAVADCYEDRTLRVRFLLALRKDYFSDLGEFQERLPNIYVNEFRLSNLTRDQAMDAIVGPVQTVDSSVSYDPDLLHELLADLETSGMELPHLQIICSQLYEGCA
jgi:hypothetical protein